MSLAKRTSRLIFGVILLASGLLAPGIVAPEEASAKNTVHVDNKKKIISITVQADLVNGDSGYADYLQRSFKEHWGQDFEYRCYTVKIALDLKVLPKGTLPADDAPRHRIVLDEIDPGDPYVAGFERPRTYRPSDHSGEVHVSDFSVPGTIAHEFGHVLGLPDEYTYVDTDGDGRRSYDEPSVLDHSFPEVKWSLMGDSWSGSVLPRHIKSIVEQHAPRGSLECKWQGTVDYHTTLTTAAADVSGTQEFPLHMTLEFEEDENGVLSGRGEATANYMAEFFSSTCYAHEVGMPESFPVLVSGNRSDEGMQLIVQSDGPTPALSFTATNCAGDSVTAPSPLFWWLDDPSYWPPTTLTARGDDNVYLYDETGLYHEVYPVGGSFTNSDTTIIITVEPADDGGVPVG